MTRSDVQAIIEEATPFYRQLRQLYLVIDAPIAGDTQKAGAPMRRARLEADARAFEELMREVRDVNAAARLQESRGAHRRLDMYEIAKSPDRRRGATRPGPRTSPAVGAAARDRRRGHRVAAAAPSRRRRQAAADGASGAAAAAADRARLVQWLSRARVARYPSRRRSLPSRRTSTPARSRRLPRRYASAFAVADAAPPRHARCRRSSSTLSVR